MSEQNLMPRYSVITDKNPREIVLLRGDGCKWLQMEKMYVL